MTDQVSRHTLAEVLDSISNKCKRNYFRLFGLHDGQHTGVILRNIEFLHMLNGNCGAPGTIRTCDPLIRSQVLYPAELRVLPVLYLPMRRGKRKGRIANCFSCRAAAGRCENRCRQPRSLRAQAGHHARAKALPQLPGPSRCHLCAPSLETVGRACL